MIQPTKNEDGASEKDGKARRVIPVAVDTRRMTRLLETAFSPTIFGPK